MYASPVRAGLVYYQVSRGSSAHIVLFYCVAHPGKSSGRELSPNGKEIEPSGFQQNIRLKILKLAPQELNLGPRH